MIDGGVYEVNGDTLYGSGREVEESPIEPTKPVPLFYIQNSGFEGNCMRWWCVDGKGYTTNLEEAWQVTKEEADRICRSRPKEDIPHLVSVIDSVARRHVNIEVLRAHQQGRKS